LDRHQIDGRHANENVSASSNESDI